jgi:hypothetical protein
MSTYSRMCGASRLYSFFKYTRVRVNELRKINKFKTTILRWVFAKVHGPHDLLTLNILDEVSVGSTALQAGRTTPAQTTPSQHTQLKFNICICTKPQPPPSYAATCNFSSTSLSD